MRDHFVVQYLSDGHWYVTAHVEGCDEKSEESAKEAARDLWRRGVSAVRILRVRHEVFLESHREARTGSDTTSRRGGTAAAAD